MKLRIPWVIRLLVSVGVLGLLLAFVPAGSLWDAVRHAPLDLMLLVLLGFLVGHVISAFKWWRLLTLHANVTLHTALRAHFTGLLGNLCLPGVAGGDLVRAATVLGQSEGKTGIAVTCVADRLIDTFSLLVLSLLGALWMAQLSTWAGQTLLITAGLAVLAILGVGLAWRWRAARSPLLQRVASAVYLLLRSPGLLAQSLALSLLVQGGFVVLNVWLGSALGVDVPTGAWFLAWPLAKLIACLPVSLGGLGVREVVMVVLLRPFGADAAAVTSAGLIWYGLFVVGGLIGVLVLLIPGAPATVPVEEVSVQ